MLATKDRSMPRCDVPDERLIAYLDGYLPDPSWRTLAAHLPTCPGCRARLEAFREVEQILRSAPPPLDGARVRGAVAARLRAEAVRGRRRRPPRLALAVGASLLLLAVLVPVSSNAGFGFGRFLRIDQVEVTDRYAEPTVLAVDPTMPWSADAPAFHAVEPSELPLALALVGRSLPTPTLLELQYLNPDGIAVWLTETPQAEGAITLDPSAARQLVRVGETDVLALLDPRPGSVAALVWERDGIVFELLVISTPVGGLPLADGVRIVEALIAAQDAE